MRSPDWKKAQPFKQALAADGWQSPDTYCNYFAPLENKPGVYLFLLHKPYAEGMLGFDRVVVAYVGMSRHVKTRLATHDVLPKIETPDAWVMRWFKPTPLKALREAEGEYIRRFDPPWNIIGRSRGVIVQ